MKVLSLASFSGKYSIFARKAIFARKNIASTNERGALAVHGGVVLTHARVLKGRLV